MKGITLPSNVMVYLIITILVISAVVIYVLEYYPNEEDYYFLLKSGCVELARNCDNPNWQNIVIEGKIKSYTMAELCTLNNIKTLENCKKSCGC